MLTRGEEPIAYHTREIIRSARALFAGGGRIDCGAYADDALDLCDVLGSYVSGSEVKLDEVSKILGLTGKPEGVDGSRVEEMVLD
jgi:hypothetical protein